MDVDAGCTIYIPDVGGLLAPAKDLVFNDAPWLGAHPEIRFVHPKLSHEVPIQP